MNGCEFQQSSEAPTTGEASTSAVGLPRAPMPEWQQRQFQSLLDKLAEWRSDDHEDAIVLCRSEIIAILEGVKACQNRPISEGLDKALQDEMGHPPASIMKDEP